MTGKKKKYRTENIRGTFIVTGNDKKNQDFKDLTKEQIEAYKFNNADLENQKEDKNIIEINIKQVILIALLIIQYLKIQIR